MSNPTTDSTKKVTYRLPIEKLRRLNAQARGLDLNCRKDQETLVERTPGSSSNDLFAFLVLHCDVPASDVTCLIKDRATDRLSVVRERNNLFKQQQARTPMFSAATFSPAGK